jgi:hypothetical protein
MDWIYIAQDTVQSQAFVNTTMNLTVSWCQVSNTASFTALNHIQYCSRQLGRSSQFNYQWLQSFLFAATLKLGQKLTEPPTQRVPGLFVNVKAAKIHSSPISRLRGMVLN